jgi:biopolymer transport protein ExbB/TolQ
LLILATAAQILKPFLRTPTRVVTTVRRVVVVLVMSLIILFQVLLVTVLVLAIRQWGEIKEFSVHFASKVKNNTEKEKLRDL